MPEWLLVFPGEWVLIGAFAVGLAVLCMGISWALDALACRINRGRSQRRWL